MLLIILSLLTFLVGADLSHGAAVQEECVDNGGARSSTKALLQMSHSYSEDQVANGTGACQYCMCTVSVTDAVKCGRSLVDCGLSWTKACGIRRRRRWKFKCSWNPVRKHCWKDNTCLDSVFDFADCMKEIAGKIGGDDAQKMVKRITDTGCNSPDKCLKQVEKGIKSVFDDLKKSVQDGASKAIDEVKSSIGDAKRQLKQMKRDGEVTVRYVKKAAKSLVDYLKSLLTGIKRWRFPLRSEDLCSPAGGGRWYMKPTDCGTFTEMKQIKKSPHKIFDHVVAKFGECLAKTGLLKFPTPFWELKWDKVCLPDEMKSGLEQFIGLWINSGRLMNKMNNPIGRLFGILKFATKRLGFDLSLLSREVHALRKGLTLGSESESSAASCGARANWGTEYAYGMSVTFEIGRISSSFDLEFSVLIGCKNNKFLLPNIIFRLSQSYGLSARGSGGLGFSPGLSTSLTFHEEYPSFGNRAGFGASLDLGASIEIPKAPGMSGGFSMSVFPAPSTASRPKSWGCSLSVSPTSEMQTNQSINEKVAVATREAKKTNEDQFTAVLIAGASHLQDLFQQEHYLNDVRAKAWEMKNKALKAAASFADVGHNLSALATHAHFAGLVDIEVASTASFEFCVTPGKCHGQ